MSYAITRERPDTETAMQLIAELNAALGPLYPTESQHGYSVEKLIREDVHFFVMREGARAVGCGGVQLRGGFGELKRMYVRPQFQGRGFGRAMLRHLEAHARGQDCGMLRLETGIYQFEAIRLYERGGFVRIPPFAPYCEDPMSIFLEKRLEP